MPKEDGGPAFPGTRAEHFPGTTVHPALETQVSYPGMTLRDYFAAQAVGAAAAAYASGAIPPEEGVPASKVIADVSYTIADAMLQERSK